MYAHQINGLIGTLEEIDIMDDETKEVLNEQYLDKLKVRLNFSPF